MKSLWSGYKKFVKNGNKKDYVMNILVTMLGKESAYGDMNSSDFIFFKSKVFIGINRWIGSEKEIK